MPALRCVALARGVGVIYFARSRRTQAKNRAPKFPARRRESLLPAPNSTATPPSHGVRRNGNHRLRFGARSARDFAQMKKLKAVFDPRGIFAPGRFAGGL